jgi:glycosyltransferase involved in cell wall biosynthesis
MTPLRIAVTTLYLPGESKIGVGYQVHEFANHLVRRGHSVTVFSPSAPGVGAEYAVHEVDPGSSLRTFRFAWRLRDRDLRGFDILHAHGDDCFLAGVRRPPHIRTVHGSCFAEARRVPGIREKARMALLGCGEVASTFIADRTVAVSNATTRLYPWIDQVIPCGVDVERFASGADATPRDPVPTILFVGTYENRKRGRLLVEAFQRIVRPAMPDTRLLMVCSDAPPSPGVEALGRVSAAELVTLYRRAWVFCLPSSYEGFGVPYIEAMAAGCPVVSTPNPGAREVLAEGRYGAIVAPDELGETLVRLLGDERARAELAGRASLHVRQYGWRRVTDDYESVYASLLA